MEVYRLVRDKYAGALTVPGLPARWNRSDEFVLYASQSRSLATLELLVNGVTRRAEVAYKVMVLEIPDRHLAVQMDRLPSNWQSLMAYPYTQAVGSKWYWEQSELVMSVPSAVIPKERNFLVNTRHSDFARSVRILGLEDYFWDERLAQV